MIFCIGSLSLESPDQSISTRFSPWINLIPLTTAISLVQVTKSFHLGYYHFLLVGLPFLTGFYIRYTHSIIDYSLHVSQRSHLEHKSELVTPFLNTLKDFPTTFRIKSKVLILVNKTIHDLSSSILSKPLPFTQSLQPPYFSLCRPSMLPNVPPLSLIQADSYFGAFAFTVLSAWCALSLKLLSYCLRSSRYPLKIPLSIKFYPIVLLCFSL